jgi:Spy/CpxP family protein refolding chaperone
MKRKLILTLLACGAGVMLCPRAQAQTADTTGTSPTSATPAAPASTAADETPDGHRRGAGILRHLTEELDLSGTQQAAVAQILEAAKPKMRALREKAKADRDALIASVSAQITPLLTPDQQTKFSEMVEKFKNGPGVGAQAPARKGGRYSAEAQLQKMTTALGLTADQQSQIKPILDAAQKQAKTIFTNTSLTQGQKFSQFKQAMEGANSQINGILTPAQQAQFAALKEQVKRHLHGKGEAPATPSVSGTTSA